MCGIAGIWHLDNSKLELPRLRKFTDSLAHRGPDGFGYELLNSETLGLGHRRLSILDLSEAGKQPMYSPDKDLVISFNGEIYNFLEIRNELTADGFVFKTQTDTEVILAAYKKWGKNCLTKFNGMFAIAIWNATEKELFIARDRFGVKPLYFLFIPNKLFAFASETIAFKNLESYKREINQENLNIALNEPSILEGSDKTIFKNIHQLLSGHFLTLNSSSDLKIKTWWVTKENLVPVAKNYADQIEEFRSLFEDACKLRMRSDVPLATALSGGLDSSSVYCTIHKIKNSNATLERTPTNWQHAFVATFPNTKVDEKKYAENVVNHIGGKAVYIVPDYTNLVNEVVKSSKLFDGIIHTPITAISDVYKSMRANGIVVSMDGHGVDEMMYGYNTYVNTAFYEALKNHDLSKAEEYAKIVCGLSNNSTSKSYTELINKAQNSSIIKRSLSRLKNKLSPLQKTNQFHQNSEHWIKYTSEKAISDIFEKEISFNSKSESENLLYRDFHYSDLPINLRDFDRASMQNGIEIRMPFMDYRLVSYVFSLPQSSKLGGGFTKRILRDAMKNILPDSIRTRTLKIGINSPDEWYTSELKDYIFDTFSSSNFKTSIFWNGKNINKKLQESYKNNTLSKNTFNQIWALTTAHIIIND